MNITLETVRDTLRRPFGKDSFTSGFITAVEATESCPTACINAAGRLQYNPTFAETHLGTPQALFCLIVHELCHCLFRHSTHGYGHLENLGEDALINAFITQAFLEASDTGVLFRDFYQPEGLHGLLRPYSDLRHSRFGPLYDQLYTANRQISSGEVIQALRVLVPSEREARTIVLLGSHGEGENGPASGAMEGIAEDLGRALDRGNAAGPGGSLIELFRKRIASAVAIKRAVLRRYTTSRRLDNFIESLRNRRMGVSPIPITPSKRELIMLHAGVMPPHFRRPMIRESTSRKGLAVYLDVSGSVQEHLPRILGILARLQDVLTSIYLFSTEVREIPYRQLLAGRISTTYGTSFDCVANSILEQGFERAVILTDGHAYLSGDVHNALKASKSRLLTVLFGGAMSCPSLAPFGEVMELEKVTG